ncbi:MAG: hypothetical protein II938_01590, partial [Alphaproteobacteria bacterium]|nr:hypothetical protein [Alphaproteobacteria bacterium]
VGRGAFKPGHQEYQDINTLKALFEFFVSKHMKTELAYNVEKCCYIPLSEFKPDVIFYSRPFGVAHVHDVPETSKFALSCYVPYFISNSPTWVEAKGYFQNHLWKYFLINQDLQNEYAVDMANKGKNLAVVGYPLMESYIGYKPLKNRKNYVIYAPHWSVGDTTLKYATFDWNGKFMLEFAKKHSEIKWVFKPHPILKGKLVESGLMTPEEVEQYWQEWDKIGIKYEGPDYLDLFKQSRALITDCGSFLAEYMPTQNPVVLLRSKNATPYNFLAQKVTKFYYSVWNLEELKEKLDTIILKGQDPWKERRLAMLKSLQLVTNASENIINVLNKEFNIK